MTAYKLPPTDEKADYVLQQFNRIAKGYDLTNDAISLGMHRAWKHKAIKSLAIKPQGKYLDVCTGTGDLAMLMAKQPNFNGEITGLDFSPGMLAVAKERENQTRKTSTLLANLSWVEGNAETLPFADNYFDGAIISFGLRNLVDLQAGLNEMARVVKPGGKVINLDLGQPTTPLFTPLFFFFFDRIVPLIGLALQQDKQAYTYLPESRKKYPPPEKLTQMFKQAGMTDVQWQPLAIGSVAMHIGSAP
ncbi:MAG: bifunctional demethylmenaquinone methyltransferase/2-methoxy-6-polyprenyl-1,4-benzoquinol methylase UbiE [Candidatus Obscuribacterales bacterium]|nr:bifunctional demethylmenaquinone methyltransferase/2-methoxy-6-polyprenyl-1,4-benzoquinol methylase UbiE [Candidatus Obscuribacterales bacterium]